MNYKQSPLISQDFKRIFPYVAIKLEGLKNCSLLITGGAGFMGSWISELIYYLNTRENWNTKLYILDNNFDYFGRNLLHITNSDFVCLINADVRYIYDIPNDVNYIIHAAATPDSRFHATSPMETMTTIANGTANILSISNLLSNLKKFVNVSSGNVYQINNSTKNIKEEYFSSPFVIKPSSAYFEAKRYAEVLCSAARSEARIPLITIRPFTFCGAYQDLEAPWFLNNFINDGLHQRPVKILSDGKAFRSLMYGADLAFWILVIMLNSDTGKIFNVGNDNGFEILEIAKIIAKSFNPIPSIITNTAVVPLADSSCFVPNIDTVKENFGLEIYTETKSAINKTIEWYKLNNKWNKLQRYV